MRIALAGLVIVSFTCSWALGQNAAQPGVTGQRPQGGQAIQPTQPGQPPQPGQIRGGQGAQAVQPGQQGQFTRQGQQGQQGQASMGDREIAAKIFGGCHNEVELAKFVQSRLQSQEAKQFAERMIKDHTPDCEAYAHFAGDLVSHTGQHAGGQQPRGQQPGGHANWVSIHNQLAQQCLQTLQKEFSQKEGKELDQCYMTQQAMAHTEMKDKLTVLKQHASPQLAQQIEKSLEGVNAHLEEAKEIVKKLEDGPSERVSRRNEGKQ